MGAIATKGLGANAAVPAATFTLLKAEARGYVGQATVFEDLCVMWLRLKEGGLAIAAKQMLELAAIGLKPAEIEAAVSRAEALAGVAQAAAKKQNVGTAGHQVQRPSGGGVGLRGRKK